MAAESAKSSAVSAGNAASSAYNRTATTRCHILHSLGCSCSSFVRKGSIYMLKRYGDSTPPSRMPRVSLKGVPMSSPRRSIL
eukprot:2832147-Karenia_brevis.AAC.1